MLTSTVTLGDLVDKALIELQDPAEQGLLLVLSDTLTASSSDTTFTVTDGAKLNVSDIVEFGSELMLVTEKTSDTVPVFTCSRGYYGTTVAAHASGDSGLANPQFARYRVAEAVKRAFTRLDALGLPNITSSVMNRATGLQYVSMPSNTRKVLRVGYVNETTGRWFDIGGWEFVDDVPTATVSTGKLLRIPSNITNTDDLQVTYQIPYRWSTYPTAPTEASTITIMEGAEELPAQYAAAWMVGRREISRSEIDRSEEWNRSETVRNGGSTTLVRLLWSQFYQGLDEAKRLVRVPIHRPYVRMPKLV